MAALRGIAAAIGATIWFAAAAAAQSPPSSAVHLGVASCSGSTCHGATERAATSRIPGNEYTIWSTRDKHRRAYMALLGEPALKMARALGLPDAAHQKLCLGCHTDDVPAARQGPLFHLSDGVGCEACHGGASGWLGQHIAGASHRDNLAAGLYPLEQPVARAEKCLGCHAGDATHFVDHRLLGAGHPRLAFELDTYTATEPAHFVVDDSYIQRMGHISDAQIWAAGQAVALVKRMDALLDPKRAHSGVFPEFSFYDCQSCHHQFQPLQGPRPTATGLGPGTVKFDDANAVMLSLAATRVAPAAAHALDGYRRSLVRAAADGGAVHGDAAAIRNLAAGLVQRMAAHDFTGGDLHDLADALTAMARAPDEWRLSHAEQTAMALEAIVASLEASGGVTGQQRASIKKAMDALYASFGSAADAAVRPDALAAALRNLQHAIGR